MEPREGPAAPQTLMPGTCHIHLNPDSAQPDGTRMQEPGDSMDYTEIVRDALSFTKQGAFENQGRWLRLILATILLGIPLNGYVMRIYRGEAPAPEVDRWGRLFIDGLKLMIIGLIWSIPIIIIWIAAYGALVTALLSGDTGILSSWTPNTALVLFMYLVEIVVGIFLPVAMIRFARSDRLTESFRFSAIADHIGRIGWIGYIIGLLIVAVLVGVPAMAIVCIFILLGIVAALFSGFSPAVILGIIALAVLVILIISPLFSVFQARYLSRLYDSAAPLPAPAPE
jgi:Protein of unknown function (DUF4013)